MYVPQPMTERLLKGSLLGSKLLSKCKNVLSCKSVISKY